LNGVAYISSAMIRVQAIPTYTDLAKPPFSY
jgi:hypothetical protein